MNISTTNLTLVYCKRYKISVRASKRAANIRRKWMNKCCFRYDFCEQFPTKNISGWRGEGLKTCPDYSVIHPWISCTVSTLILTFQFAFISHTKTTTVTKYFEILNSLSNCQIYDLTKDTRIRYTYWTEECVGFTWKSFDVLPTPRAESSVGGASSASR